MHFAITLAEIVSETALLAGLFGVLTVPELMNTGGAALGAVLSVVVVLFLHGYYLTRPICGILWTGDRPWLYAAVVALLFIAHAAIAFFRLKPSLTPEAVQKAPLFLLVGSVAVFSCAWIGRRQLRRWARQE